MVVPQSKRNGSDLDAKLELQHQKVQFKTYLSDALDSYMKQVYKKAMTSYQKALELVSLNGNQKVT